MLKTNHLIAPVPAYC